MLKSDDLQRARSTYFKTRHIWFAGSLLDAHERVGLLTVAAQLRQFAFLTHLKPDAQRQIISLVSTLGFESRVLNAHFDVHIGMREVSAPSTNAYTTVRKRQRFFGLGVWLANNRVSQRRLTITQLGSALGYPDCCVRMDVRTKEEDHQLSLQAITHEFGDDPAQVTWALTRGCAIRKSSYAYLQRWNRRYRLTLSRFPFVLHTACDKCLKHSDGPSATLNASYERLAKEISEELHFLIRWAAHIASGGL